MRRWLTWLLIATVWLVGACGDGVVIISVNSGTIFGNPRCDGAGGDFLLHESGGLEVLVVITSTTHIVVAGTTGTCTDLFSDDVVQVSGRERDGRITATEITVD